MVDFILWEVMSFNLVEVTDVSGGGWVGENPASNFRINMKVVG